STSPTPTIPGSSRSGSDQPPGSLAPVKRFHLHLVLALVLVLAGAGTVLWMTGHLDFFQPWWLLGLALVPVFARVAHRGRAGLPSHTNAVSLALRLVVILLLVAALADVQLILRNRDLCVFFLMD